MDLNINGNPGQGNHFTEIKQDINIGYVEHYNNATTIHNTYQDGKLVETKKKEPAPATDTEIINKEILGYVGKTLCLVEEQWKPIYMDLWNDILKLRDVTAEIYDRGRQHNTTFNRNFVANIIYYLGNFRKNGAGLYGSYNATKVVTELEGKTGCSTRTELGQQPSHDIRLALDALLKKYDIV